MTSYQMNLQHSSKYRKSTTTLRKQLHLVIHSQRDIKKQLQSAVKREENIHVFFQPICSIRLASLFHSRAQSLHLICCIKVKSWIMWTFWKKYFFTYILQRTLTFVTTDMLWGPMKHIAENGKTNKQSSPRKILNSKNQFSIMNITFSFSFRPTITMLFKIATHTCTQSPFSALLFSFFMALIIF